MKKTVSVEVWEKAIEEVKNGNSIRKTAVSYKLSHETLRRKCLGISPILTKFGRKNTYLSKGDEQGIVELIEFRSGAGKNITLSELRYIVREAALTQSQKHENLTVPDTFPNKKWIQRFLKKYDNIFNDKSEIRFKTPNIEASPSTCSNPSIPHVEAFIAAGKNSTLLLSNPVCSSLHSHLDGDSLRVVGFHLENFQALVQQKKIEAVII